MSEQGYKLEIFATINITFNDDALSPEDGSFYLKSIKCDEDEPKILSTFSEGADKESENQSIILADFWEEGIDFSWYKDDEDFDYWVVEVRGEVIIEPLSPPEDWYPGDGSLSLLELEFRRNGDSPPETFSEFNLIEGMVEEVYVMVKNEDDDWEMLEDDDD